MARQVKVTTVNGTENRYKIITSVNNTVQDHTLYTAAKLRTNTGVTLADSEVDATDWDFTNPGYLIVKFGLAEVQKGTYTCHLITKDSTNTIGIAWETDIILTVLP